jgi:hypothetical protein
VSELLDIRRGKPSASRAAVYEKCAATHQACKGFKNESSPAAQAGTNQHNYMDGEEVALTEEQLESCTEAEAQKIGVMDFMFPDWRDKPPMVITEERMWFKGNRYSGVPDLLAIKDKKALLVDYKFGRGRVAHAKDNSQLKWLSVLVDEKYDVDEITGVIIQPACGNYTMATRTKPQLKNARRSVMSTLRRMEAENPAARPGADQCRYCRAREACPALHKKTEGIMRIGKVEALSPVQLGAALDMVDAVESACRSIRKRAGEVLIEDANAIPGYTLKRASSRRSVSDTAAVFCRLADAGYVTQDEFMDACSIGVGKVQKLVQQNGNVGQAEAKKIINTLLHGCVVEKEGELKPCRAE